MTRLVVGLDGSAAAAAALRWAADLARPIGATILAVHACGGADHADPTSPSGAATTPDLLVEQWLEAAGLDPAIGVEVTVRQGDPRQVLLAVSEVEHPDLVVVGRGGDRIGIGPEHLGRVAGYTARHNPWPLAVVPVGARHHHPRIVLGVDGSPGAGTAATWCARYAAALDASVIAVDVVETGAQSDPRANDVDIRKRADSETDRWVEPLTSAGIAVEVVPLLHQYPADALLHAADSHHADVIVIGTRGTGGFDGLHVGGTALKLLRRAQVPLVLVPRRDDPEAVAPA